MIYQVLIVRIVKQLLNSRSDDSQDNINIDGDYWREICGYDKTTGNEMLQQETRHINYNSDMEEYVS